MTREFPVALEQFSDFVEPFISAISLIKPDDERAPPGDHHGTGSFFLLDDVRLLITCEHVANVPANVILGMTQYRAEHAISIPGIFSTSEYPVDIAAIHIPDRNWGRVSHAARCVELNMLSKRHEPVDGEYLFVYGFPGEDAVVGFGEHSHRGLGVFLHEIEFSSVTVDEEPKPVEPHHFFIPYSPNHARLLEGSNSVLSRAEGMSGSLVWNTRYTEVTSQGEEWRPEDARVTGVLWGHSSKVGALVVTKIEYLRYFLGIDED
ncbi:hypothetical protein [uncultured Pseudomonas sp.]|uniref:hypothetical protein n=1 Tax=uncultured Pseudomonas sp. TaxID=114707 RepID=UPI002586BC4C|nr:hypothetical protein [uncultured Pseudomonas sp.]